VAVGYYANGAFPEAVIEKWNGVAWARVKVPVPADFSDLVAVSCPTAKYCVAVGGTLAGALVESWNGAAWQRVSAPTPVPRFFGALLDSVSCVSPSSCEAVGFGVGPGNTLGFAETWNGKAWTTTRVPWPKGTSNSGLFEVSCVSRNYCAAVGNIGQNLRFAENAGRPAALRWNGKAWALQPVTGLAKGQAGAFGSVSCRSATNCVAVGNIGSAGSTLGTGLSGFWNGKAWTLVPAV
jgi:hypothetical protein